MKNLYINNVAYPMNVNNLVSACLSICLKYRKVLVYVMYETYKP